jgi:hypothetical protein
LVLWDDRRMRNDIWTLRFVFDALSLYHLIFSVLS